MSKKLIDIQEAKSLPHYFQGTKNHIIYGNNFIFSPIKKHCYFKSEITVQFPKFYHQSSRKIYSTTPKPYINKQHTFMLFTNDLQKDNLKRAQKIFDQKFAMEIKQLNKKKQPIFLPKRTYRKCQICAIQINNEYEHAQTQQHKNKIKRSFSYNWINQICDQFKEQNFIQKLKQNKQKDKSKKNNKQINQKQQCSSALRRSKRINNTTKQPAQYFCEIQNKKNKKRQKSEKKNEILTLKKSNLRSLQIDYKTKHFQKTSEEISLLFVQINKNKQQLLSIQRKILKESSMNGNALIKKGIIKQQKNYKIIERNQNIQNNEQFSKQIIQSKRRRFSHYFNIKSSKV